MQLMGYVTISRPATVNLNSLDLKEMQACERLKKQILWYMMTS